MSPDNGGGSKSGRRTFHESAHKLPYRERERPSDRDDERFKREAEGKPPRDPAAAERRGPPGDTGARATTGPRPQPAAPAAPAPPPGELDVVAHAGKAVLALGALGVVFGDIGTSPLYTEQVTFTFKAAKHISAANVYGVISLIFWSLTVVVSIKYAGFIMRAHNRGDGGIMALAALVRRNKVARAGVLVTLGIFGASLFFGDGVITPAISVLSAVSGLEVVTPGLAHAVVPISVAILVGLFMIQRKGTGAVGWLFGPVMLLWFAVLAILGAREVLQHPGIIQALSPVWGARFFSHHGFRAFLALGGVVLAVTGAEALYADRGHFGPAPIRAAWFGIVLPGVLLNYLGQGALVLAHPADKRNPFFLMVPGWGQVPMVVLATVATVIASQAVISGSYSVAKQAMQLGYLPRLRVVHTSKLEGQVYVPVINWLLAIGVVALVLAFRNSNRLANAYGVAVTGTFVLNTVLFLAVARAMWRPPWWRLISLGALFLTVEVAFFLSNLAKILDGAWLPLVAGATLSVVMLTWHWGRDIVTERRTAKEGPLDEFLAGLVTADPPVRRVPGTAVFLTPGKATTPLALRAEIEHTHALHDTVLLVSVAEVSAPDVDDHERFEIEWLGPEEFSLRHVTIRMGYQELPHVPDALRLARRELLLERDLDLEGASYFISRITLASQADEPKFWRWREKLFLGMARNAANPIEHFGLPIDRTVSLGSLITV
jgi:KUP system potassium uptake protein